MNNISLSRQDQRLIAFVIYSVSIIMAFDLNVSIAIAYFDTVKYISNNFTVDNIVVETIRLFLKVIEIYKI